MDMLVEKALSSGFTKAARLDGLKLECEPWLRDYCGPGNCPDYEKSWVCPPGSGSIAECAEKVGRFDMGIIMQSVYELNSTGKNYITLNRIHNFRLQLFIETCCGEYDDLLALTSCGCVFCDVCTYPKPCEKPDMRMNSLSAFGIDVRKLCEKAQLDYAFRPDKVYYIALVMLGQKVKKEHDIILIGRDAPDNESTNKTAN